MFLSRVKRIFALTLALFISALAFTFLRGAYACKLCAISGERTFYLYTPTSQSTQTQTLTLLTLDKVRGESVRFSVKEQSTTYLAQEIIRQYNAVVQFSESVGSVQSYYAYTPKWKNAITINGVKVNLHIAYSLEECVVGSPIIFGGF